MIVIVGHGPSVLRGLGSVIDTHTVVRLKHGLNAKPKPDPFHWGTRTDYLCARSLIFKDEKSKVPFWHFSDPPKWLDYYAGFEPRNAKPSTGLCAVFMALDNLAPQEIGLIGFDRLTNPNDRKSRKWYDTPSTSLYGHDQRAEHECLMSLPVKIVNMGEM